MRHVKMHYERDIPILFELVPTAHLARFHVADNAADLHDAQGPPIADIAYTSSTQKHYNIPLSIL